MSQKYYPVLLEYVGPSRAGLAEHLKNRIRVLSEPGRKNLNREQCLNGWLGTTDDWSQTALGELSEDETRALLQKHGVKIPDGSPIKFDDYSFGAETSEGYNQQFVY